MLARRVASLETELVFAENRLARTRAAGEEPAAAELDLYARLSNAQRRLMEAIGIEPARDITAPTLKQYLEAKAGDAA